MDATGFMLGNIVARRDDHIPDTVVAIEERMVHLSRRKLPDDERDIEGVPLVNWIKEQTNGSIKGKIIISLKGIDLKFDIKGSGKKAKAILVLINCGCNAGPILAHLHQLQNLVYVVTGIKLDTDQKWPIII